MNLAFYIYKFLRERGTSVVVPHFGVFCLEKKHAVVDEKASKILPPSERFSFEKKEVSDDGVLVNFISQQARKDFSEIQNRITQEVEKWKQELTLNKKLILENLGQIEVSEEMTWNFISKEPEDSFGLEVIELGAVNNESDYILKKSILWGFLAIAPLVALVYSGVRYQDLIFGKVSFENTHRIKEEPKTKPLKKDSLSKDSLVVDSVKVIPNQVIPIKK